MSRSYQISNNVIFSVNEDGSISKFAMISENGEITKLGESKPIQRKRRTWGFWVAIIALIAACITLFCLYIDADSNYNSQWWETSSVRGELSTLRTEVGGTFPLIIKSIEIANTEYGGDIETDYGKTIYSRNTMFLKPRIKYYGVVSGEKTLKVKLYQPNGRLSTGDSSPSGYSFSCDVNIQTGANNSIELSSWGNKDRGYWGRGKCRIEIWYKNSCLKSETFTIY